MSQKKLYVTIALVLALLILAIALIWIIASRPNDAPNAPKETTAVSDEPDITASPEPSLAPTPTPTPVPTSTPEPVDDGKGHTRDLNLSGAFKSDSGTQLNLGVEWSVVSKNDEELLVSVTVKLYHFSIGIGPRHGTVAVGDQRDGFLSAALELEAVEDYITSTVLHTSSFTIPCALGESLELPISASWDYNGSYSRVDIKTIETSDTIVING